MLSMIDKFAAPYFDPTKRGLKENSIKNEQLLEYLLLLYSYFACFCIIWLHYGLYLEH